MRPIIDGDDNFKIKTLEALILIQYKSEEKAEVVLKYISEIKQSENSKRLEENLINKSFSFDKTTYTSQTEWYASCIVHDAYHSKLYHDCYAIHGGSIPNDIHIHVDNKDNKDNKNDIDIFSVEKEEYACLEYQISFLEEINADKSLIDYAKSLGNAKWWEKPATW